MIRLISVTVLVFMSFVLMSCRSSLDLASIKVGPNNTVSWDDAQTIIRSGDVKAVGQNHALNVSISMENGTQYRTIEPEIDAINDVLKRCGKWGKVSYVTE
jgi:hypothetical protein